MGLSRAFNVVLKDTKYKFQENDFIIFFDQDSRISSGHVNRLVEEYKRIEDCGHKVGCIGPAFYNNSNKTIEVPRMKTMVGEHVYEVGCIITSSMLCKYEVLKSVKFWNEDIFLDMADWDLCWRLREAGEKCYMTDGIILNHSVGVGERRIGPIRLRVGNPVREYYQTRDCLNLLIKNYIPLKYRIRFVGQITIRPLLHVCFLDTPKLRIKYILWGMRDFFRGEKGALCFKE